MFLSYIYRIKECNYIGSCKDIEQRKISHSCQSNTHHNKLYDYIRNNNLKFDELIFEILEQKIFKDKIQLRKMEQHWINFYNSINYGCNSRTSFKKHNDNPIITKTKNNKDKGTK